MLKIVLDTNMILSATLFGGMVEKIVDLILENKIKFYIPSELMHEVYKKLNDFKADNSVFIKTGNGLQKGIVIKPTVTIIVCRDKEDNFVLELAETADVDYIITRDKDLLEFDSWKRTKIIKPEIFLPLLRSRGLVI